MSDKARAAAQRLIDSDDTSVFYKLYGTGEYCFSDDIRDTATALAELIEPCIKAGASERGCCPECKAPWERQVQRSERLQAANGKTGSAKGRQAAGTHGSTSLLVDGKHAVTNTIGWEPSCQCNAGDPVPCTVLDPFGGSGTTAGVAEALGRNAILCELSPDYAKLIPRRVRSICDYYYGREKSQSVESARGQLSLFGESERG